MDSTQIEQYLGFLGQKLAEMQVYNRVEVKRSQNDGICTFLSYTYYR